MRNILKEKPGGELHGRLRYTMEFIDEKDIKDKRVLDIGCGFGWFELGALRKNVKEIVGTELTDGDLETARRFVKDNRVIFKVGDATNLPFPNNSFDTVVCWEVIEHLPKKTEDKMLKEIRRVLKKNGIFYLSTPNDTFICKLFDPAWWLIGHRHYPSAKIYSLAENNTFQVKKLIIKGGFWEILGINNLYIAKWIFKNPPFFLKLINDYQDREYKKKGYTNLFVRFKKIDKIKTMKILLIDSFSLNIGDTAILKVTVEMLKKYFSKAKVSIIASHPNFLKKFKIFEKYEIFPRIIDIQNLTGYKTNKYLYIKSLVLDSVDAISFLIWAFLTRLKLNVDFLIRLSKRELALKIKNSDVVLSVGGGFISTNYNYPLRLYMYLVCFILEKRVFLLGQSIGPFETKTSRILIPPFLKKMSLITVREPYSLKYLKKFGIVKNVFETADYAFLLKESRNTNVLNFNKKSIAISIKEKTNLEERKRYIKLLVDSINYLHQKEYFVFLISQTVADDVIGKELLKLVGRGIKLIPFGVEPDFIKSVYKNCEFIISNRIHGVIFAAEVGTPFISIAYESKFQGILDQLNYPRQLRFDDGKVKYKSFIKAIDFVIKNRAFLSLQLSEESRILKNKAELNVKLLKNYLE